MIEMSDFLHQLYMMLLKDGVGVSWVNMCIHINFVMHVQLHYASEA